MFKPITDYTRDELLSKIKHYQEREHYFSKLLGVPDAGQYRADWDFHILQLMKQRDEALRETEASDEVRRSAATKAKLAAHDELRSLLTRAKPFTEGSPLFKEIGRSLASSPEPTQFREALEVAMIHLMVWHSRYADDVGDLEKVDLNWILDMLGRTKRYTHVPDKERA